MATASNGHNSNGSSASHASSSSHCGSRGAEEIKAVIYDLDGTLLDTESLSTEAIQAVVGRFNATFTWCVVSHAGTCSGSTLSHLSLS